MMTSNQIRISNQNEKQSAYPCGCPASATTGGGLVPPDSANGDMHFFCAPTSGAWGRGGTMPTSTTDAKGLTATQNWTTESVVQPDQLCESHSCDDGQPTSSSEMETVFTSERDAVVDPTRRSRNGRRKNRLRQRVYDLHGAHCVYCGTHIAKPGKYTLDHLQPRSRGGDKSIENLRPSCLTCNQSKADRTPAEWAADIMRVASTHNGYGLALWTSLRTVAAAIVAAVLFWR